MLTGLLFLHRISDNRMTGTSRKNTDIFEMVCGPDALQNVILVTTMWDGMDIAIGSQREKELRTYFWQSMIAFGSQIARFESTYQSAWKILNQFTGDALPLLLQKEMVEENKSLPQTTAGSAHFRWLRPLVTQFRDIVAALRQLFSGFPKRPEIGVQPEEKTTNTDDGKGVNLPIDKQPMPLEMGDILPVTKDPSNWFLFTHPDNSHYDTLSELANSSRRSFKIIELWQKQRWFVCFSTAGNYSDCCSFESINRSPHPLIKEMVDNIAKQGPAYYRAIQKSAETARRGCSFASDAIDFCNQLRKAEASVEMLRAGLDDIKEVAKYAHQEAQEMHQQFKDVRVELFKVRFLLATYPTINSFLRHQILKNIPSGALSLYNRLYLICRLTSPAFSQVAKRIKMFSRNSYRRAMI